MAGHERAYVEIDAATGIILHAATETYTGHGFSSPEQMVAAVDQEVAALSQRVAARGRIFRDQTGRGLPDPRFHKWDGAKWIKKTKGDFGPPPPAPQPDNRPDPATFPEPPPA